MRSRKVLVGAFAAGALLMAMAAPAAAQTFRDVPGVGDTFCDGWLEFNEGDDPFHESVCGTPGEENGEEPPEDENGDDRAAQCALIDPIIEGFEEGGAPEALVDLLKTIGDTLGCPAAEDEPAPGEPPPPEPSPPPEQPPAPVLPRTGGALLGLGALGLAGLGGLGLAIRRFLG